MALDLTEYCLAIGNLTINTTVFLPRHIYGTCFTLAHNVFVTAAHVIPQNEMPI
jgi:hypothetical protein